MARMQYAGAAPQVHLNAQIAANATSFVSDGTATAYPDGSVGNFVVILGAGTATAEKVKCSARSGTTFTVATSGRGYDGTSASIHAAGETIDHCIDATSLTDLAGHVYDATRDDHTQYAKTDGSRAITGHRLSTGSAPAVAAGAGAGSGATASIVGTDTKGIITVLTGTGTSADVALVTVTFNSAYGSVPAVVITPVNVTGAVASLYLAAAPLVGSFVVQGHATPPASDTLKFSYLVIG